MVQTVIAVGKELFHLQSLGKGGRVVCLTACKKMFLNPTYFTLPFVPGCRYELHSRVCGPWSVWGVLPLPLENGQQPIPCWTPNPEPCGYFCLGVHLLCALQKENFLEDLGAGSTSWKHFEGCKQEKNLQRHMDFREKPFLLFGSSLLKRTCKRQTFLDLKPAGSCPENRFF